MWLINWQKLRSPWWCKVWLFLNIHESEVSVGSLFILEYSLWAMNILIIIYIWWSSRLSFYGLIIPYYSKTSSRCKLSFHGANSWQSHWILDSFGWGYTRQWMLALSSWEPQGRKSIPKVGRWLPFNGWSDFYFYYFIPAILRTCRTNNVKSYSIEKNDKLFITDSSVIQIKVQTLCSFTKEKMCRFLYQKRLLQLLQSQVHDFKFLHTPYAYYVLTMSLSSGCLCYIHHLYLSNYGDFLHKKDIRHLQRIFITCKLTNHFVVNFWRKTKKIC